MYMYMHILHKYDKEKDLHSKQMTCRSRAVVLSILVYAAITSTLPVHIQQQCKRYLTDHKSQDKPNLMHKSGFGMVIDHEHIIQKS